MKFKIKNRFSGNVMFSLNTKSFKLCVEVAVETRTDLSEADLSGTDLSGANLSGATLSGTDLFWANLSGADLSGANLSGTDLSGANLYRTNFYRTNLSETDLSGTNLSGTNLSGATLSGTDLSGADLSEADLSEANLSGTDLCRTNFYRTNLSEADLSGADLSGADLSGADLSGTDLCRTNFYRTNLSETNLSGTTGINPYMTTPLFLFNDQIGKIRAYKLVNSKQEGIYKGGIVYKIGQTVSVKNACTDKTQQCAAGISLATLDWCIREWQEGYKILIAEFTRKDIAAIPIATDGKFRVSKCKIVGEKDLGEIGLIKTNKKGG